MFRLPTSFIFTMAPALSDEQILIFIGYFKDANALFTWAFENNILNHHAVVERMCELNTQVSSIFHYSFRI